MSEDRFTSASHAEEESEASDASYADDRPSTGRVDQPRTDRVQAPITGADELDQPRARLVEEQLRRTQKMAALGQLATGIAHDFNNLLTLITGYSKLALGKLDEDDPAYRHVLQIEKAGVQASELVDQLLTFGREDSPRIESVNLNEVIDEFDRMLRRIIGDSIALRTELDANLSDVLINPNQIDQVLMNLAINARDAMDGGGVLTFRTDMLRFSPSSPVLPEGLNPGRYVRLTVSDTGCGMDAETRARIFEPFFTTKDRGRGTGLGLSTTFGIVTRYGGTIVVDSAPGQGTTFEVYLPVDETSGELHIELTSLEEDSTGYEMVLVVDDNIDVRSYTAMVLADYGYRVVEASCSSEAIELYHRHRQSLSLVVCDTGAASSDIEAMMERVRAQYGSIGVLWLSGSPHEAVDGIEGCGLLRKPYSPEQLASAVRQLIDETVAENLH